MEHTEDCCDLYMNPTAEPTPPEWKVYFEGNFWGHRGRDHAGKEVPLGKGFTWGGHRWVIPAAYSCGKGLVVDFCMQVEQEEIRAFLEKWNLNTENGSAENFTRERRMQMELENPLILHFSPRLKLNGKILRSSHGCSLCFNPCIPEGVAGEPEAKWTVGHYGLDDSYGWVICRNAFPWVGRRPALKTLRLIMEQQPVQVPGSHFTVHQAGERFRLSHPVSGETYELTVEELERQTLPKEAFGSNRWLYPTHTVAMTYTLFPEPEESVQICDCAEGDRPLEIESSKPFAPTAAAGAAVIGIIGGADGPTAIVVGDNPKSKLHAAYSSLHFAPVEDDIEWRVEFRIRQFGEASFVLL